MNKLFKSIVMVSAFLLVSACTTNTDQSSNQNVTPELVEVDILIPEDISRCMKKVGSTVSKRPLKRMEYITFKPM